MKYNIRKFCLDKEKDISDYQELRRKIEENESLGWNSRSIHQFDYKDRFYLVVEWWDETEEEASKSKESRSKSEIPPDGVSKA